MPPHASVNRSPRRKRAGRLVYTMFTLAATALISFAAGASPAAAKTSVPKVSAMPVKLSVFSPGARDIAGKDGAGFVVDLSLTARNRAANALLAPEAGYKPFFNNPTSPTFAPGADQGAPGLVVMLSTTPNTPGTPFQGPNTNLAGLFQINGVSTVKNALTQTWNTWQIGKAAFGSGPVTLTAFVVKGTAPTVVPDTGLERISNTVKVPFTITSPPPAPAANANATLKMTNDLKLGSILVDATGRTVYRFEKDQGTMSACTGACASAWPALRASGTPTAGTGVDPAKVGSANGQVTYDGHLLYFYSGDRNPGDTLGASIPNFDAVSPAGMDAHAA